MGSLFFFWPKLKFTKCVAAKATCGQLAMWAYPLSPILSCYIHVDVPTFVPDDIMMLHCHLGFLPKHFRAFSASCFGGCVEVHIHGHTTGLPVVLSLFATTTCFNSIARVVSADARRTVISCHSTGVRSILSFRLDSLNSMVDSWHLS